jgi:hypothetical protein
LASDGLEISAETQQQTVPGDRRARRQEENDAVFWGEDLLDHVAVEITDAAES